MNEAIASSVATARPDRSAGESPGFDSTATSDAKEVSGLESLLVQTGLYMRVRGVGPKELVLFSLAFAATAAFVFLLGHPGLGGLLGLIALLLGEVSLVPPSSEHDAPLALSASLNPLVDLLTLAGVIGYVAGWLSPALLVLALAALVLAAWLPLLKATAGPERVSVTAGLWRRGERMAVLLLGAMLGRLGPALLIVLVIGILDAWLRVERVGHPAGVHAKIGPQFARRILDGDGSFVPAVRWGTLAVTVIALWFLPQSTAWRF